MYNLAKYVDVNLMIHYLKFSSSFKCKKFKLVDHFCLICKLYSSFFIVYTTNTTLIFNLTLSSDRHRKSQIFIKPDFKDFFEKLCT